MVIKIDGFKKAKCNVENCNEPPMSNNTTTMGKHLSRKHKIFWKPREATPQPPITSFESSPKQINKPINSEIEAKINSNLALAMATSSASHRFIENIFFKKALSLLNPSYTPISHQTIGRLIKSKFQELKELLIFKISNAESISITVDYWSSTNFLGFIGVVVSTMEESKKINMLVAVRYAPSPHTAANILNLTNEILCEYGIQTVEDPRVFSITTDNGSNIVCAYKDIKHDFTKILTQSDKDAVEDEFNIDFSEDDSDETDGFAEFILKKRIACSLIC